MTPWALLPKTFAFRHLGKRRLKHTQIDIVQHADEDAGLLLLVGGGEVGQEEFVNAAVAVGSNAVCYYRVVFWVMFSSTPRRPCA